MPANFAGWLHQRFQSGGEGRFRLAHFDPNLRKTFRGSLSRGLSKNVGLPRPGANMMAGLSAAPAYTRSDGLALRMSISYPLNGDRYLLPPGAESVQVTGKAMCREPFKKINWFVDGREVAATGPPYELPLKMFRGRHRITVVGPGSQGDSVEVLVE